MTDVVVKILPPEQGEVKNTVLSVKDLYVTFNTLSGLIHAVNGVSFDLKEGEILGLVGESGSGKSVSCKALIQLLPSYAEIKGTVNYRGDDLVKMSHKEIARYRGESISMIFQDPVGCLNPIKTIFSHLKEVLIKNGDKKNLRRRAKEQLKSLHIKLSGKRLRDYPFQFSGGMAQRVQIAMAMAGGPDILIADEPTTALDVTIQARILNELKRVSRKRNLAVILVTHDLGVVAEICDRVAVMYHGRIVEMGDTEQVISFPRHPYTRALMSIIPVIGDQSRKMTPIPGECLPAAVEVQGCDFADRCDRVDEYCKTVKPVTEEYIGHNYSCFHPYKDIPVAASDFPSEAERFVSNKILLEVKNLSCIFEIRSESGGKEKLAAVDNVSFHLYEGEIFGIVGESGSGKSTLANAVMGMLNPVEGNVIFNGQKLNREGWNLKDYARQVQYVFQDPLGALDPRMDILKQTAEPLLIHGVKSQKERLSRARNMLKQCGLNELLFLQKPYGLSGGQRQRAVLARALVNNPRLLICDEPVSAMDVSVQAQILNLLKKLVIENNVTVLFISHDLSVVHDMCDRVAVMYAGQIVETGTMKKIFNNPEHPYTKLLIDSIPKINFNRKERPNRAIQGEYHAVTCNAL